MITEPPQYETTTPAPSISSSDHNAKGTLTDFDDSAAQAEVGDTYAQSNLGVINGAGVP